MAWPVSEKNVDEAIVTDFEFTKIEFGPSSHEGDVYNFQVSATKLVKRTKKKKQTRDVLKQVQVLTYYLKSIVNSSSMPIDVVPTSAIPLSKSVIEK